MEAGTHSIWISQQLSELGREVIAANVRELGRFSHSDHKSDQRHACLIRRSARCRCARLTIERGEEGSVGTVPSLIPGALRWVGTSCRQAVALRNNAGKASAGERPIPCKNPERVGPRCATRPPNHREDGERRAALCRFG